MALCPKCNINLAEGMLFCPQCGARVAATATPAPAATNVAKPSPPAATLSKPIAAGAAPGSPKTPPPSQPASTATAAMKPAGPSAVPASSGPASSEAPRPEVEGPDEPPRRVSSAPGGVVCRFCKGPLDLQGEFCEQCGAPVGEAAPPGMIKPKATAAAEPGAPAAPSRPAQVPSGAPPVTSSAVPIKSPATAPSAQKSPPPPPKTTGSTQALSGARREVPAAASLPGQLTTGTRAATPSGGPTKAPATAPAQPKKPAAVPARAATAIAPRAAPGAPKKSFPMPLLVSAIGLVVVCVAGAVWYFHWSKSGSETAAPQVATPPAVPAAPGPVESRPAATQPKAARVTKPSPPPAPAARGTSPQAAQITDLQNLAREAYTKGNYAEPLATSAIAYSKQVLAIHPGDDYAKTLLENSVNGGKYQVQQAISGRDFATAHRVANALAQLLSGRQDLAGLKEDIVSAEKADDAARRPKGVAGSAVSFPVDHMHTEKAPADGGPHCVGSLSVTAQRMRFTGQSASDGHVHNLEFTCSEVREIKKNARVASKQGGFHVRTASANFNFVPKDSPVAVVPTLASACSK